MRLTTRALWLIVFRSAEFVLQDSIKLCSWIASCFYKMKREQCCYKKEKQRPKQVRWSPSRRLNSVCCLGSKGSQSLRISCTVDRPMSSPIGLAGIVIGDSALFLSWLHHNSFCERGLFLFLLRRVPTTRQMKQPVVQVEHKEMKLTESWPTAWLLVGEHAWRMTDERSFLTNQCQTLEGVDHYRRTSCFECSSSWFASGVLWSTGNLNQGVSTSRGFFVARVS